MLFGIYKKNWCLETQLCAVPFCLWFYDLLPNATDGQARHTVLAFHTLIGKCVYPLLNGNKSAKYFSLLGSVPSEKISHWAIVCFSEHNYFKAELADFEMNYKLFEWLG